MPIPDWLLFVFPSNCTALGFGLAGIWFYVCWFSRRVLGIKGEINDEKEIDLLERVMRRMEVILDT